MPRHSTARYPMSLTLAAWQYGVWQDREAGRTSKPRHSKHTLTALTDEQAQELYTQMYGA